MTELLEETGPCPFSRFSARARRFDPFGPEYLADPAGALRWSREEVPVFYSEEIGYWIVTRYHDIKAVFRDNVAFSAANVLEKMVPPTPEAQDILKSYGFDLRKTLVNEDEPIHMERRRALLDAFAPAALAGHEKMVRKLVRDRVDAIIDNGRADLVQSLLWDIPLTVALHFLGIPENDMDKLRQFSVAHTLNVWGKPSDAQQIELAHGVGKFWAYSGEVLAGMKETPDRSGWMYDMIRANREMPEVVTDNYLHSMMMAIIVAAHETTALAGANMMRRMLENREAWRTVCGNPELIPNAVEECLRHSGSMVAWRRLAVRDVVVGGVTIPAGGRVLLVAASGNHDARQFDNPDDLDLWRDNTASHLTFGYGSHQCMGKNIGRMELRVILEELSRRLPHMELEEQQFTVLPNVTFHGPERVLVRWDPDKNPERKDASRRTDDRSFPIGAPDVRAVTRTLVVAAVEQLSDSVREITLVDQTGARLPAWSAGAHIDLHLPGGMVRKYSLCGEDGAWSIAVQLEKLSRGGSRWLHEQLKCTETLEIRGPRNHFRLDEEASNHLLIAGGIGITPIVAMADHLKMRNRGFTLHYAGQRRNDMAYLDRIKRDHPDAHIWVGEEGQRIDLEKCISALPAGSQICVCGPQRLISAVEEICSYRNDLTLSFEHFNPPDHALARDDDAAFVVELLDSELTLNIPANRTLLDTLQEAGIDIPVDCGEGLCGTCEVDVVEGDIDHRDRVLTASERKEGRRMMSCCSRSAGPKLKIRL